MSRLAALLSRRNKPSRRTLFLERLEDRSLLTAGLLDPNFGSGGKVTTDISASTLDLVSRNSIVVQPDGKVVVAGTAYADFSDL